MKRSIIISLTLIVLFAMPTLAKTMVAVTNPILDDGFMLDELSDENLEHIIGSLEVVGTSINEGIWKKTKEIIQNFSEVEKWLQNIVKIKLQKYGVNINSNATIIIIVYSEIGGNDFLIIIQIQNPDPK